MLIDMVSISFRIKVTTKISTSLTARNVAMVIFRLRVRLELGLGLGLNPTAFITF